MVIDKVGRVDYRLIINVRRQMTEIWEKQCRIVREIADRLVAAADMIEQDDLPAALTLVAAAEKLIPYADADMIFTISPECNWLKQAQSMRVILERELERREREVK